MTYYKREDFKTSIETKYNKYSKSYLHVVRLYKILGDDKFQNINLYSGEMLSGDFTIAKQYLEEFENNFIVVSSCEINLNYPLTGQNYDTVWVVDLDKNIVKCLNGVTGAESYYIDTILDFKGDILAPCSGTPGRWNRLEINYPEFKEQLGRIIQENNKDMARKELHKINSDMIREEINNGPTN